MPVLMDNSSIHQPNMTRSSVVKLDLHGKVESVKLILQSDCLVIEKEELAYTMSPSAGQVDSSILNKDRVVLLKREKIGGLGLSVKGGAEHQLPIIISRIFKDQAADRTGQLYVGDAILKVDDFDLQGMTHDEAVKCLKQTGETVTLTVCYYRPASLLLNSSKTSTDEEQALMGEVETGPVPQWTTLHKMNLLWAYVTRYIGSSDQVKPDGFSVVSMDRVNCGIIYCDSRETAQEWIDAINTTIDALNSQSILLTNKSLPVDEKVHYMCWAHLRTQENLKPAVWEPVFICFKGSDLSLFEGPPVKTKDEVIRRDMCPLYESMMKVVKDDELEGRRNCVILEIGPGRVYYLGLETRHLLLALEKAWYRCMYTVLQLNQSKSYNCTWRGQDSQLMLKLQEGLSVITLADQVCAWSYKFSQLKGSTDDGHSKLQLHFLNEVTNILEMRELDCPNLRQLLFVIHAFYAARLAVVDPEFLVPWTA